MWRRARDLRLLMLFIAAAGSITRAVAAGGESGVTRLSPDGAKIEILASIDPATVAVAPLLNGQPGPSLMGRTEPSAKGVTFFPAAPLLAGRKYRVRWQSQSGAQVEVDVMRTADAAAAPTVAMRPAGPLPANALKVYLHFSEPMEQGVFLDRLRLLDGQGKEVPGPFRETELWSPDGKRLTVWFHPGRQKAGVNLNVDEGPVLRDGGNYRLVVAGSWRSAAGVALGEDVEFRFAAGPEDHMCPQLADWRVSAPPAGRRDALRVRFDERLDPAMLHTALRVKGEGNREIAGKAKIRENGAIWEWRPAEPWRAGRYELCAEPDLEDLAGNSLAKPFEVDLADSRPSPHLPSGITFEIVSGL